MRGFLPLPVVVCLILGTSGTGAAPPKEETAPDLEQRIGQLGSRRFRDREEAVTVLIRQRSPQAVALLREAARHPDPEIRRRAEDILAVVERALETERVLRPSLLRLDYRDVLVPDAVNDLARRTGLKLLLHEGDREKLAGRRLTVSTDEVGCWEALQRFCAAAGLSERSPDPVNRQEADLYDSFRGGRRIALWGREPYRPQPSELPIVLADGGKPRPMFLAGGLRLQVLDRPSGLLGPPGPRVKFIVQIDTEDRPGRSRLAGIRVESAIDDLGQRLVQPTMLVGEMPRVSYEEEWILALETWDHAAPTRTHQGAVELQPGKTPARRIVELRGTLLAEVEAAAAPLVTVPDPLRSAGKSGTGPDGTTFKLVEAAEEDGQYKLRVQVRRPLNPNQQAALGMLIQLPNAGAVAEGGTVDLSAAEVDQAGIGLYDPEGQPYLLVTAHYRAAPAQEPREYVLYYQPRKDQGPPGRLVFSGRRHALVEVPFVLKDVPLP